MARERIVIYLYNSCGTMAKVYQLDGIGNNDWWINKHTCQNTFLSLSPWCWALAETQFALANVDSHFYPSPCVFFTSFRVKAHSFTHRFSICFIYLYISSGVGVAVVIIHSSAHNANSTSIFFPFPFMRFNPTIRLWFYLRRREIVSRFHWLPIIYFRELYWFSYITTYDSIVNIEKFQLFYFSFKIRNKMFLFLHFSLFSLWTFCRKSYFWI